MQLLFLAFFLLLLGNVDETLSQNAPLDCEQPPALDNGDTKASMKFMYRHNEKVEYICQNFYVMQGGPFKTCNNGEWTGEIRCLQPCTVDSAALHQHNIAFKHVSHLEKIYLAHNDLVGFRCTRGRHVGPHAMRQRCVDGQMNLPTCQ